MSMAVGIITVAMTAASALIGAANAVQQGNQQNAMYNAQAQTANTQARYTELQGEMQNLQQRQEAAEMQNEATRLRAKQFAQAAGQGYALDSESFLGVVAAAASQAEKDRQQVLRNGRLAQAEAYDQAKFGYASAQNYHVAGKVAKQNGQWTAATSLLTGIGQTGLAMHKAGWFENNGGYWDKALHQNVSAPVRH